MNMLTLFALSFEADVVLEDVFARATGFVEAEVG